MDIFDNALKLKKVYSALIDGDTTTFEGCRAILGRIVGVVTCGTRTFKQFEACKERSAVSNTLRAQLRADVIDKLEKAVTPYYARLIPDIIIDEIVEDVEVSSDYATCGTWDDDDIRLAIGRILLKGAGTQDE